MPSRPSTLNVSSPSDHVNLGRSTMPSTDIFHYAFYGDFTLSYVLITPLDHYVTKYAITLMSDKIKHSKNIQYSLKQNLISALHFKTIKRLLFPQCLRLTSIPGHLPVREPSSYSLHSHGALTVRSFCLNTLSVWVEERMREHQSPLTVLPSPAPHTDCCRDRHLRLPSPATQQLIPPHRLPRDLGHHSQWRWHHGH